MDASFHIRPFAFDRVFVASAGPGLSDTPDDIPALRAEIEALKMQIEIGGEVCRADGFEAGLAHAREETASALLAATDALQASVEAIEIEFEAIETRLSAAASELALATAEGLAARAIEADPAMAIDEAIARVLTQVARGQELQIRVHPALIPAMETLLAQRQSRERRRLSLCSHCRRHTCPRRCLDRLGTRRGLTLNAAGRRAAILAELGLASELGRKFCRQ